MFTKIWPVCNIYHNVSLHVPRKIKSQHFCGRYQKIYQHKELNINPAHLDQYSLRLKRPKKNSHHAALLSIHCRVWSVGWPLSLAISRNHWYLCLHTFEQRAPISKLIPNKIFSLFQQQCYIWASTWGSTTNSSPEIQQ